MLRRRTGKCELLAGPFLRRPSGGSGCGLLLYRCYQLLRGRAGRSRILSRDQKAVTDHVTPPVHDLREDRAQRPLPPKERGFSQPTVATTGATRRHKAAQFDRETCRWIILGEASDVHRSKEERLVIETLRSSGPLNVRVIMNATGMARNKLDLMLGRMIKAGTVEKPERGVYALPPEPTAEEENLR
jgi:hypothetical protein